jgi:hypothetical protein
MLVLVPTREDVLAIRSIEEAFDLWTRKVTKREKDLIRIASASKLLRFTVHAAFEADDEMIPQSAILGVVERAKRSSKDLGDDGSRQVGINFEGAIPDKRRIRTKVAWQDGYLIVTVHTIGMIG